ncbi:MAG: hypothetical protein RMJ52_15300 [Gemmataceae bacterium]|nr:hypothetical protein [Gemmataceae bacterium]
MVTTKHTKDTKEEEEEKKIEEEDEGMEEDEQSRGKAMKGFSQPFNLVRRFAQPLGIHLETWERRCIATEKGIVRLISVLERTRQLFGEAGAEAVAQRPENVKSGPVQLSLFDGEPRKTRKTQPPKQGTKTDETTLEPHSVTILDKVHMAMLLQSSGQTNALRPLLKSEIERGPDFLHLANALSALYLPGSDEKHLLDAMLLAVPR